jgi:hypothetical protein
MLKNGPIKNYIQLREYFRRGNVFTENELQLCENVVGADGCPISREYAAGCFMVESDQCMGP